MPQSIEAYLNNSEDFFSAIEDNTHTTVVQDGEIGHESPLENLLENTALFALIGFIALIALVVYYFRRRR